MITHSFTGEVEDIMDPFQMGRVKVRIHGLHSQEKLPNDKSGKGIDVKALPWAQVMLPITSSSMSEVGLSATGISVGSWVYGVSLDGENFQHLLILGSIPTKFDMSKLAIGENTIKKTLDSGNGWSEPETKYATVYPNNKVFQSSSGHVIEIDDTPNAERIHIYHKSGSFVEFFPDGKVVHKTKDSSYEIVEKDKNLLVKGKINIKVDNDANIEVGGSLNANVKTSAKISANTIAVSGDSNVSVDGGAVSISGDSKVDVSGGKVDINGKSKVSIGAAAMVDISAAAIKLQGSMAIKI